MGDEIGEKPLLFVFVDGISEQKPFRVVQIFILTPKIKCMKRNRWSRVAAVVLAALLLWWLFWAILADEDMQQIDETNVEIME